MKNPVLRHHVLKRLAGILGTVLALFVTDSLPASMAEEQPVLILPLSSLNRMATVTAPSPERKSLTLASGAISIRGRTIANIDANGGITDQKGHFLGRMILVDDSTGGGKRYDFTGPDGFAIGNIAPDGTVTGPEGYLGKIDDFSERHDPVFIAGVIPKDGGYVDGDGHVTGNFDCGHVPQGNYGAAALLVLGGPIHIPGTTLPPHRIKHPPILPPIHYPE